MPTSVSTFPSEVLCKEDNAMPKSTRKCLAAAATSVGRQGYECYRQCVPQCCECYTATGLRLEML